MYYYIVNPGAGNGAIDAIQEKLKALLHNTGIDGEFAKTTGPGDGTTIAKAAIEKGFKTIVAVGGDATVNEVIAAVSEFPDNKVAIGIIPIGKKNLLANRLGINDWRQACEVLASRRLSDYQLMSVNNHAFLYSFQLSLQPPEEPGQPLQPLQYLAELDGKYKLRGLSDGIEVYNQKFLSNPLSNRLVLRVHPVLKQPSNSFKNIYAKLFSTHRPEPYTQLYAQRLSLECPDKVSSFIDGREIKGKRFRISLSKTALRLITALDKPSKGTGV